MDFFLNKFAYQLLEPYNCTAVKKICDIDHHPEYFTNVNVTISTSQMTIELSSDAVAKSLSSIQQQSFNPKPPDTSRLCSADPFLESII
jgi:hypothetical protein